MFAVCLKATEHVPQVLLQKLRNHYIGYLSQQSNGKFKLLTHKHMYTRQTTCFFLKGSVQHSMRLEPDTSAFGVPSRAQERAWGLVRTVGKSVRDPVSLCEHPLSPCRLESQQVPCLKQAQTDLGCYDLAEMWQYLMLSIQLHVMVSVNIILI